MSEIPSYLLKKTDWPCTEQNQVPNEMLSRACWPQISIITPSYNQGTFLEATIKSILEQKGKFYIDYIIMDGGSIDESVNIIKKYDKLISQGLFPISCEGITMRWNSAIDNGQVDAIKKGFFIAEGEIGTWINSDDMYNDNEVLMRVIEEFQKDPSTDIVTGDGYFIDKHGNRYAEHRVNELNFTELIYLDYHILQPATFLKKRVYKKVDLDETYDYCFDAKYFIDILQNGYKMKKINDMLALFRVYPEIKTLSGQEKRHKESLAISKIYASNSIYYFVSFIYKYLDMVLSQKHPSNRLVMLITAIARRVAYKIILNRWHR